ncbi:MAG: hypothetical protein NC411_06825 [Bacteroides sp.]|nr:hypothetical protein [Bacteroides sp.]
MHLHLTRSQMLDMWRLHCSYSPSLSDAVFCRNDGIDTAAIHGAEMDRWYRQLLTEAPGEYLVADDLSESVEMSADSDGSTLIAMPQSVVRVLNVRLESWKRKARVVTSPTHIVAVRQRYPFTRATTAHPVAIFHDNELHLYPAATPSDKLLTLDCVTYTDNEYNFDTSALSLIPHPQLNP